MRACEMDRVQSNAIDNAVLMRRYGVGSKVEMACSRPLSAMRLLLKVLGELT